MQKVARLLHIRSSLPLCRSSHSAHDASPSTSSVVSTRMDKVIKGDVPVEKRSLSRGLALNKFEKDFMIYPEYTDTDDLRTLEGYVNVLKESLSRTVDERSLEKNGELSAEVLTALQSSQVTGSFVPKEYGGLGMNYKDLMRVNEELSVDWSISAHCTIYHMAISLLLLYGTSEQKEKYLPLIASGKCRPAIAFPTAEGSSQVHGSSSAGLEGRVMADGVSVMETPNANLLFVFATIKDAAKDKHLRCYIVDRTKMNEGDKWLTTRNDTLGLKALHIGRASLVVSVKEKNMLSGEGKEIFSEALSSTRLPLASAAIGYGKRLLRDLATIANSSESPITPNASLSSHLHIHRIVSQLSLDLYSLESVVYYLAGLVDEKLPIVVDVENALVHRLTRSFLRRSTTTLLEIVGSRAIDSHELFEKRIRDVASLMAIFDESDGVEQIAMATMSVWTVENMMNNSRGYSTLRRLFGAEKTLADLRDPKLKHFIAEHAHPSLQMACQELEHSMIRLDAVLNKLIGNDGKQVQTDYQSLERLVKVLENNLVMVCTISRSSRSYSIGLRNADAELAWTTWISAAKSRQTWLHLNELADFFGLIRLNNSLLKSGRSVLEWGGYDIESPIERNW